MWTPDQTAHRSSLIRIYTVCNRDLKNISADNESRRFFVIGTLRVNKCEFSLYMVKIFIKNLRGSNKLLTLYQMMNTTWFPLLTRWYSRTRLEYFFLFDLILYVPVNNLSVMSGRVFLGWTCTKLGLMCLPQGHNAVTPVRLEPVALRSRVKHWATALPTRPRYEY